MMKDRKEKSGTPILAAGGIVLRNDYDLGQQVAVVQSRKLQTWGLPKGKLAAGEDAMTAARREVLEETGHRVTVHEFLGTLVYETSSRPKVIQFWRMEAVGGPAGDLMRDVVAVDWLVLEDAVSRLTHLREQIFLEQVGPIALKLAERSAGSALRGVIPGVPLAPAADAALVSLADNEGERAPAERAGSRPFERDFAARFAPAADVLTPAVPDEQDMAVQVAEAEAGAGRMSEKHSPQKSLSERSLRPGKTLMRKTWGWFRHAALHWQPLD